MKIGILHTAFIGDVVLLGLMIDALFESGHEIIFFTKKNTTDIFLNDIRVKKIIVVEKQKGFKKIWAPKQIAAQISKENCDILLVPHRSATSTLSAYFSNVPVKIGFKQASLSFLYGEKVDYILSQHECVRYLSLLKSDIVEKSVLNKAYQLGRPVLRYSQKSFTQFDEKFLNLTNSICPQLAHVKDSYFVLSVGSVWKTKKYLIEYWVHVVGLFLNQYPQFTCVLSGGESDKSDVETFKNLFLSQFEPLKSKILTVVGQFSLSEFAVLLSGSKFLLSNDSSPIHFASSYNIPILCVFGPTIPEFGFAPTSEFSVVVTVSTGSGEILTCRPCSAHGKNACPQGHFRCMKDLQPKTVFVELENLLKNCKII